jgi:hypothetical protein
MSRFSALLEQTSAAHQSARRKGIKLRLEPLEDRTLLACPVEPLLHQSNLQYLGAFRVPNYYDSTDEMSFSQGILAFNPANNSLFIAGHYTSLAEIGIPQPIVNSTNLDDLSTASILQGWTDVLGQLPNPLDPTGLTLFGGLVVDNGTLVGSVYKYKDGAYTQSTSHFVLSSLDLSEATVGGAYTVGDSTQARTLAGFMSPIPSEWQSVLGAPFLTGQGDIPIISTTSAGPSAFGFDPETLGSGSTPAIPYLYYPNGHELAPYDYTINPLQSGNSSINGVIFVPGTSTILYFGKTGTNYNGYGNASDYNDSVETTNPSPHSLNGQYALQIWAYNANDLVAVKQGLLQPWEVQPYDVWNMPGHDIGGAAYDPQTGRLYVSITNVDQEAHLSALPLIDVFQVNVTPESASAPPHIGTMAVTPVTLAGGPVVAGTDVVLTAGNVYDGMASGIVSQVVFYLDTNNTGVFQPCTDQILGYASAGSTVDASHAWQLTIPTTGMAPGTYTIFAQAESSDGLFSDPSSTTLTIV